MKKKYIYLVIITIIVFIVINFNKSYNIIDFIKKHKNDQILLEEIDKEQNKKVICFYGMFLIQKNYRIIEIQLL